MSEFIKRYTSNNVFRCKDTNQQTSNYIEIQKLLTQAKSSSVLKAQIEAQIKEFLDKFNTTFQFPLNNYKKRLKDIQDEYTKLNNNFRIMSGQFVNNTNKFVPGTNYLDKKGLLKISDCSNNYLI